jgi:nucleoside-diphosphate-sugar epimerase
MKVVVIGGAGLIGSNVVVKLDQHGHQAVARAAVGQPVGGIREVAAPDQYPLDDVVRARLRAQGDTTRRVIMDPQARYFGVVLDYHTLVPATSATVFGTRFGYWLIDDAPAPVR